MNTLISYIELICERSSYLIFSDLHTKNLFLLMLRRVTATLKHKNQKILILSPKTWKYCYTFLFLKKLSRGSRPEVFCEKGVLRNFAKFTGKHLCQSLFLIKLQVPPQAEHLWWLLLTSQGFVL